MYSRCASLSQRKTEWIFDFWVLILDFRSERGSVSRSASEHQAAFGQLDCARPTALRVKDPRSVLRADFISSACEASTAYALSHL